MLAQRVASAAVGVPIILLLIWLGGPWYIAAVCAALAVASLEYQHAQGREWLDPGSVLFAAINAGIAGYLERHGLAHVADLRGTLKLHTDQGNSAG